MQMIKASVDLPPINKNLKWKVSATICSPSQPGQAAKDFVAYSAGEYRGNLYHKFSPRTYLIIEPVDYQNDVSYFDKTLYMDAMTCFKFKELLKELKNGFSTQSLFYYQDGVLKLDKEIAKKSVKTMAVYDKHIKMSYMVIQDPDNSSDEYEGIVIFVNDYTYAITITSTEVGFMIDTLEKLNMTEIGLQLIIGVLRSKS